MKGYAEREHLRTSFRVQRYGNSPKLLLHNLRGILPKSEKNLTGRYIVDLRKTKDCPNVLRCSIRTDFKNEN